MAEGARDKLAGFLGKGCLAERVVLPIDICAGCSVCAINYGHITDYAGGGSMADNLLAR